MLLKNILIAPYHIHKMMIHVVATTSCHLKQCPHYVSIVEVPIPNHEPISNL